MTSVALAAHAQNKTYSPQIQSVVEWDENMETPIDTIPVMKEYERINSLPEYEKRKEKAKLNDLMREARGLKPE